jgi:hypothetical protein
MGAPVSAHPARTYPPKDDWSIRVNLPPLTGHPSSTS